MEINIAETSVFYPSTSPFVEDHVLPLSHLDNDRNLAVTFRYLRVYAATNTNNPTADPFQVITSALSPTLVDYYPLTGSLRRRHDGRLELHCAAGKGLPVVRATADFSLESVGYLNDPSADWIDKLAPNPDQDATLETPAILQITVFSCGGYVLGTALHHAMCDGMGATLFFNTMAELARGETRIKFKPVWDRTTLLGPRDPPRIEFPIEEVLSLDKEFSPYAAEDEPVIRQCFEVKEKWLDLLKAFLVQQSGSNYTSFEALGAFLWRARVKASRIPADQKVKFAYATNIRKTVQPPLPLGYWGNGCVPIFAQAIAKEVMEQPLSETADLIKKSKSSITNEYVRSFVDFQEVNYEKGITGGKDVSGFTDWRHLGHSLVDFGWGGPLTVFPISRHIIGSPEPTFFLPYSASKDGFKVMVHLKKSAIPAFKDEIERLSKLQFN